jgi:hypothetical protein
LQPLAFGGVLRQVRSPFKRNSSFIESAEFEQEVGPDTREAVRILEERFVCERVCEFQTSRRAERHTESYSTSEFHHRRRKHIPKFCIQFRHPDPVRLFGRSCSGMTRRYFALKHVYASRTADSLCTRKRSQAPLYQQPVPTGPILVR